MKQFTIPLYARCAMRGRVVVEAETFDKAKELAVAKAKEDPQSVQVWDYDFTHPGLDSEVEP